MNPISIEGQQLALRELREDDAEALHAIYGSEQATEHLSFEPRDREAVAGIVLGGIADANREPRTVYALAVTLEGNAELMGYARLAVEPHRAGQIGFALNPSAWGRSYGTETVRLLLRLGFDVLGLHRIWGARSPKNTASAAVMSRNGMVEEGRIRDHVFTHGAWRDSITHVILEGEWRRSE
ncbi:ribosomal-protein-alanine N-acetyltransferase [Catenulispora sp. GP43]|uniref:GNAT family N-acetyltransferase n=1 Tax=Catenulispora sp. GP43 TaxID=3156263 RepID=UPI00351479A3